MATRTITTGGGNLLEIYSIAGGAPDAKVLTIDGIKGSTTDGHPAKEQTYKLSVTNIDRNETVGKWDTFMTNYLNDFTEETSDEEFEDGTKDTISFADVPLAKQFIFIYYYGTKGTNRDVIFGTGFLTGESGNTTTASKTSQTANLEITVLEQATTITVDAADFAATKVTGAVQTYGGGTADYGKIVALPKA